ncbi:MAG TPA: peptide ABC transporter ATP-binding protein [Firmicutes bacterium]|jgi:oligopeptide transport system ATP-binding protein|nr:peptide ABC transporter ATP-binding protein [Bacillota bacterium]
MNTLLDVKDLKTSFYTYAGEVKAVDGVSFQLDAGEALAIVGESGCGKSVTALSIMGLVQDPGKIVNGQICLNGRDLTLASNKELCGVRGNEIGMIFQDPLTSLNPVLSIEQQMIESLMLHQKLSKRQAITRGIELLKMVGIPAAEDRFYQYPHQFSGGMRQRVMIAMAMACGPKILIADEPTTALDVTIQAQILELMKGVRKSLNTAIVLITHDLGVVAGLCQRVLVMYAGKIVERAPIEDLYYRPKHPYTWGLLGALPRLDAEDNQKRKLTPIWGKPPDLLAPPPGCRFAPRCQYAMKICEREVPPDFEITPQHQAACWLLDPRAPKVEHFPEGSAAL